jgi:hypothetical protein
MRARRGFYARGPRPGQGRRAAMLRMGAAIGIRGLGPRILSKREGRARAARPGLSPAREHWAQAHRPGPSRARARAAGRVCECVGTTGTSPSVDGRVCREVRKSVRAQRGGQVGEDSETRRAGQTGRIRRRSRPRTRSSSGTTAMALTRRRTRQERRAAGRSAGRQIRGCPFDSPGIGASADSGGNG